MKINQPVHVVDVNYVVSPLKMNINHGHSKGLKIYLQATKEIDKQTDKLDISVSNSKGITYDFISPGNKYVWGRFAFMLNTCTGAKYFRVLEQIMLEDIQNQAHGYFGPQVIGNVNQNLENVLPVSSLTKLAGGNAIEIEKFHDRVLFRYDSRYN